MSIVPRQQPNTMYLPPVIGASPSRALHISHSAPNLSPMQAVQISRRNQPLTVLQQSLCLGARATRCQFPTVGEQCIQVLKFFKIHILISKNDNFLLNFLWFVLMGKPVILNPQMSLKLWKEW